MDRTGQLLIALGLMAAGCAHYDPLPAPHADLATAGMDAGQRAALGGVLDTLGGLQATRLRIDPARYRRLSQFHRRFGFSLSGPALRAWLVARIQRLRLGDPWTVAVFDGGHTIELGPRFFSLPRIDQLFILIHEARHADRDTPLHVACPPALGLGDLDACDQDARGAYGSQAALLFELYAFDLIDGARAEHLWRQTERRLWTGPPRPPAPRIPASSPTAPSPGSGPALPPSGDGRRLRPHAPR